MRNNVVLIDFENVQPDMIDFLNKDHFKVMLFCGANQTKVPYDTAVNLQKLGEKAQYIKVPGSGPNALDFHIAYYIGRVAVEDPGAFFHIVSRDKGFDPLIEHLKKNNILSCRSESISEIPSIKNADLSIEDSVKAVIAGMKEQKVSRARSEKTLIGSIKCFFKSGITDTKANQIFQSLLAVGFILLESGKIVYPDFDCLKNEKKEESFSVDQINDFIAKLKAQKTSRPRSRKTVINSIKSFNKSEITDVRANQIFQGMIDLGFISEISGQIAYSDLVVNSHGKKESNIKSESRAKDFILRFRNPKISKPRSEKTMISSIKSFFGSGTKDLDAAKILEEMVKTGFINIVDGKIVYSDSKK